MKPTPYVKLQQSGDEGTAHGKKYYIKGGFVQKSSRRAHRRHHGDDRRCEAAGGAGGEPAAGGRRHRAREPDGHRIRATRDPVQHVRARVWEDPALSDPVGQWTRSAWKNIEPHTHGFYVNEFNDDGGRMKATYGVNFDRLVALKTKFDPSNLFRLNANVAPAGAL